MKARGGAPIVRGTIGDGRGSIVVDTGSGSIRVLGR